MQNVYSEADEKAWARRELERFIDSFDADEFVSICADRNIRILFRDDNEMDEVLDLARHALEYKTPFSFVRMGDGEGNILGLLDSPMAREHHLRLANVIFRKMDGADISLAQGLPFADAMAQAFCNADVIGSRMFSYRNGAGTVGDGSWLMAALDQGDVRGAIGAAAAVRYLDRIVRDKHFRGGALTSLWIYFFMIENIESILGKTNNVIVVSGRRTVRQEFVRRWPRISFEFIDIPLQAEHDNNWKRPAHYPDVFNDVIRRLQRDLSGVLVLVGAGIFGKVYCDVAKRSGGVAGDLGSGFDLLAGHVTRPVHGSVDVKALQWMASPQDTPMPHFVRSILRRLRRLQRKWLSGR